MVWCCLESGGMGRETCVWERERLVVSNFHILETEHHRETSRKAVKPESANSTTPHTFAFYNQGTTSERTHNPTFQGVLVWFMIEMRSRVWSRLIITNKPRFPRTPKHRWERKHETWWCCPPGQNKYIVAKSQTFLHDFLHPSLKSGVILHSRNGLISHFISDFTLNETLFWLGLYWITQYPAPGYVCDIIHHSFNKTIFSVC